MAVHLKKSLNSDGASIAAIGNTPLIRLSHASAISGCEILAKAEYANPGQSVKDRASLYIIRDAEKRGLLKPGGTIVEGTAGNTGIGLTVIANALGYNTVIVIPETQSEEKKQTLRLLGAQLIEVPAVPYQDPNNYIHVSCRIAKQLAKTSSNGAFWSNQFDNTANRNAHVETTAEEIWHQTNGKVDAFVCAVGTGGTLAGVSQGLKKRNSAIKAVLADPQGAALHSYYTTGKLEAEGNSIVEGIGQKRITNNLKNAQLDMFFQISDYEAIKKTFELLKYEGLFVGASSGVNVAGALKTAKILGKGHTIVTILCDHGTRYQSKLFNSEFLRSRNLPVPDWMEKKIQIPVPFK